MNLKSSIGRAALLALFACSGSSLQGCAGDASQRPGQLDERNLGELSMHLNLSRGATVSSVSYEITGNGVFKAGTVDVSQTTQIAFQVYGIPAGQGYTITIKAGDATDAFTCSGSATFSISAGQISQVHVALRCEVADGTGGVSVDGSTNVCPILSDLTLAPTSVVVGGTIQMTALAVDSDEGPDDLSYIWTSTIGDLSGANTANASLACTTAGPGAVTLTYSDGDCSRQISLLVSCDEPGANADAGTEHDAGGSIDGGSEELDAGGEADAGTDGGLPDTTLSAAMLSLGIDYACQVLPGDGRLVCWGENDLGRLGTGTFVDQQSASFVDTRPLPNGLGTTWKLVTAGGSKICGITTTGDGYCWGSGLAGQLGVGAALSGKDLYTPTSIDVSELSPDTKWSVLTAGLESACGVTIDGTGYCWGNAQLAKLGNGDPARANQASPSRVDTSALGGISWSTISAGYYHACGIATDGAAYCWGADTNGVLGNGPALTEEQATPVAVDVTNLPAGTTWAAISASETHTCGITTAGDAYCWGSDVNGRLGNGAAITADQVSPSPVDVTSLPEGTTWATISAGRTYTCGVTTAGVAYCWGSGAAAVLGTGTTTASPSPTPVVLTALQGDVRWVAVQTSYQFTCGLTTAGITYCWGADTSGRLGNGPVLGTQRTPESPVLTTLGVLPSRTKLAASVGDVTNPGLSLALVPLATSAEEIVVTAQSSSESMLPSVNISISGSGSERTVTVTPKETGAAIITLIAQDPLGNQGMLTINYSVSGAAADPSGRYHIGIGDASAALDVGDGYMLLANDEDNLVYLYKQNESGYPVKIFDFTDNELLGTSELDIEGAARVGDTIVWVASHGNGRDGDAKEYRRVIYATTVIGSGANVQLVFAGRYGGGPGNKETRAKLGLWQDLITWDRENGHGMGADILNFAAASADGVLPNAPNGFNIEGFEFAPDGVTGWLGFRAPTIPINGTQRALIVPITNILDLVHGIPTPQTGLAQFGTPILLDLAGRSIRELRRNEFGEYLISAGPPDDPTVGVNDTWALYTWDGDPTHPPVLNQLLPEPDYLTGGAWECVVSAPHPLVSGAEVRLLTDSGDTVFYGTYGGEPKSFSQTFKLD